jgi:ferredoxin
MARKLPVQVDTCTLCPRLCRVVCPVATGTGREASVPTAMAAVVREWQHGRATDALTWEAVTLCTDCGACAAHCHLGRPLPDALRWVRQQLQPPTPPAAPSPLAPIVGDGRWVAVECDERSWAGALADRLGEPVARWRTTDRLGAAALAWTPTAHLERVRALVGARRAVVADGGVAEVLDAAQVPYSWLVDVIPGLRQGDGSCRAGGTRPLACCGAAGPLAEVHPDDARRVGEAWLERSESWQVVDGRCRDHLRACGGTTVTDAIDRWLRGEA